ncbi:MAG: serine/threonine protein kinase [Clostridia bacterium]|nr:serine/threonine protein kinase [Deltaproteobacteria bacterium]
MRDILDERGITLEARVAAALAFELALALEHAHAKGIVHRDLKPENVFWSATGRAVLADFGIAKALGDARFASTLQFGSTNLYGSPSYMAPEQVRGGKVDERTDLHGLGCLLFEVLSGAPPYVGATVEELLGRVERGEHEPVERTLGPPALVQLVEELIASAASDRPASASLVVARLRGVLDDLGVRDPRDVLARLEQSGGTRCATDRLSQSAVLDATRFVPHLRQHSQNWLVVSAGLALLVAAGLTAWLLVKPEPSVRPVAVTFVLPGEADLTIDGHAEGPVRDVQRVVLAPGRHAVEAHIYASGETIRREIFVVRGGSGAQFEF